MNATNRSERRFSKVFNFKKRDIEPCIGFEVFSFFRDFLACESNKLIQRSVGERPCSTRPMVKIKIGGESARLRCSLDHIRLQREAEKGSSNYFNDPNQ